MATEKKIIDVKLIGLEDAIRSLAALNTLFKEQDSALKNLKKAKEQDSVAIAAQTLELQKTKKAIKDLTYEVVNEVKIREKRAAQIDKQVEKEYKDLLKIDAANQKAALKKQQLDEKELNALIKKEAADNKAAAKAEEKYQREIAALIKKEEAAKTAEEKEQLRYAKLIMQVENENRRREAMIESRSQKEQIAVTKAEQRAAKEAAVLAAKTAKETGYLNQLRMAVDALEKEYYQLSEAEYKNATNKVVGSKGKQVLEDLTKQRAALQTAQAEYGKYSMNVGNYASATNMLAINLGQVMKEAPNFAISARIGIMSLTNNLPMLAEAFKAVQVQMAAMKAAGEKTPSMFSLISKSIFGLTGIMSIAMVLLQVFGSDIIDWVGKLFKGEEAVKRLTNAELGLNTVTETLHKTMESGGGTYGEAIKSIEGLKVKLEAAKGSTELSKAAVEEYNTTLGETFGKATSVDEALGKITANEKDYIEAMKNMAYANEFFSVSAKDAVKAMEISSASNSKVLGETANKYVEEINKAKERLQEGASEWVNTWDASGKKSIQLVAVSRNVLEQDLNKAINNYNQAAKAERERQIQEISNNQKISLAKATEYYNKYAGLAKKNGWDLTKEEENGTNDRLKKIKELKEYDWENVQLPQFKKEKDLMTSAARAAFKSLEQSLNEELMLDDKAVQAMEEKRAIKLQNEANFLSDKLEINQYNIEEEKTAKLEQLNFMQEQELTALYLTEEQKLAITDKYAKLRVDVENDAAQKKNDLLLRYAQQGLELANSVQQFTSALSERELNNYAKSIQGKANYDELYGKKKAELAKKNAIFERSIRSFETIISTASAIMGIWADLTIPAPMKLPMSIAAGATGAMQLGTIWATPLPEYEGGNGGGNSNVTKTTVTEKFHTGGTAGGSANSVDKSQEVTATLLKGEQILTRQQTGVFNNILGSIKSMGGSGSITSGVGVNALNQTDMIEMAMNRAFSKMPPPQVEWIQFKKFEDKMATFDQNRQL